MLFLERLKALPAVEFDPSNRVGITDTTGVAEGSSESLERRV